MTLDLSRFVPLKEESITISQAQLEWSANWDCVERQENYLVKSIRYFVDYVERSRSKNKEFHGTISSWVTVYPMKHKHCTHFIAKNRESTCSNCETYVQWSYSSPTLTSNEECNSTVYWSLTDKWQPAVFSRSIQYDENGSSAFASCSFSNESAESSGEVDNNTVFGELVVFEYNGGDEYVLRRTQVTSILKKDPRPQSIACIDREYLEFQGARIKGLNGDSLSHFQNCRVPPKTQRFVYDGTHTTTSYLSADGCPADRSQLGDCLKHRSGGETKCLMLVESYASAWPSWSGLQIGSVDNSLSFYAHSEAFLRHIESWFRRACRWLSTPTSAYSRKNIIEQQCNSFSYLLSSGLNATELRINETSIEGCVLN